MSNLQRCECHECNQFIKELRFPARDKCAPEKFGYTSGQAILGLQSLLDTALDYLDGAIGAGVWRPHEPVRKFHSEADEFLRETRATKYEL